MQPFAGPGGTGDRLLALDSEQNKWLPNELLPEKDRKKKQEPSAPAPVKVDLKRRLGIRKNT